MYKSKKPYHYGTGRRKSSVATAVTLRSTSAWRP